MDSRGGRWPDQLGNRLAKQSGAAEGNQKVAFDLAVIAAHDGRPGNEYGGDGMRQLVLLQSERFLQQAFGPIADHGAADGFAGHHTQPGMTETGNLGGLPVEDEATLDLPFALGLQPDKITACPQPAFAAQTQPVVWRRGHWMRERARLRPESGACDPADGGGRWSFDRPWTPCGREIRAGGRGESWKAGTDVS